jgi:peroxiredoxin
MALQDKLNEYKANFEKNAPPEALEVMHRATVDLRNSGILDRALKVGDKAPEFELENTSGELIRSKDILSERLMVLTFYRGKWWPYCNLELEALQNAVSDFTSLGANLVAISPQLAEYNRMLAKAKKLTFEILSDPGNLVAGKFGLVYALPEDLRKIYLQFGIDVPKHNGDDSWTLPLASRFIIDRETVIRYAEMDVDYTIRPDPEHTIKVLKSIKK